MSNSDSVDTVEAVQRWNPEIAEWRIAADEGRLLIKACGDCDRVHYYPRSLCPFCFSTNTHWQESEGLGTIYSFAIENRGSEPFTIAYVTLNEGPTIMTNIVGSAINDIEIGRPVTLDRDESVKHRAPLFRLFT